MCIRDRLYAIQLFGCEPEALEKAILLVREKGIRFDILDINMGCPAPKITNSGAGSKLLLDPPLCGRMVAAARRALGEDTPLTVKMRIGWDAEHLTGVEVAKQCEANGADLIAVHGRTREQMYVPPIDAGAIDVYKRQLLDSPDKGLIVESNMWRDMLWQQDNSVLCVAADSFYDADDYIRDYEEFLRHVGAEDPAKE